MFLTKNKYLYALFLCPLLLYMFLLGAPVYFDDLIIFKDNHWLLTGPNTSWFEVSFLDGKKSFPGYRPVLMLISQWNTQLLGANVISWRLVNLLIHIANSFLLYGVLRSFKTSQKVSFYIALLFAVHPIQTIAVQFIWKRSSSFAVFFMLLGLFQYIYFNYNKYLTGLMQVTVFALAFFCKEIAIVYPLIFAAYIFYNQHHLGPIKRKDYILLTVLSLIAIGLFWYRLAYVQSILLPHLGNMSSNRVFDKVGYFISSTRSVIQYIAWFFAPRPYLMNDPLPLSHWFNPYLFGYLTLVLLSAVTLLKQAVPSVCKFFILVFWLSMLPHTSFYPMFNIEDQIRMYWAIASLSVLSVCALETILKKWTRFSLAKIMIPIIILSMALSGLQNMKYFSPEHIWSDITEKYPSSDYAQSNLADIYYTQKKYEASLHHYQQALNSSEKPYYRIKIARSIWYINRNKQSVYDILKPINYEKLNIEEFSDFLSVFIIMKDYQKAQKLLAQVIGKFYNNEKLLYTAGKLYFDLNDYEKSALFFKQVLKINPYNDYAQGYIEKISNVLKP